MHVILESLGDPVWQIGVGIILLAALVLILALRSPEVHLAPQHQWFLTRLMLLLCFSCFLVLSAGVLLFHAANAASTAAPLVTQPTSATASPHGGLSPTSVPSPSPTPMPSPSPTPFPALTPSPAQVLTTFCDAINQQDLNTAWGQYKKALQQKRATPPPYQVRITMVHCRVEQVSDTSATGYLFLKTVGPNGYTDDVERLFQFTLRVEERAWKIAQTARCLADGCLVDTRGVTRWGNASLFSKRATRKDGMPMAQQHRGHPRGNSSDRASAKEECSLEGVVVTALSWNVHGMEALQ